MDIEKSYTARAKVGLLQLDKPKSGLTHIPFSLPAGESWPLPGSSPEPDLSFGVGEEGPLPGRHPRYESASPQGPGRLTGTSFPPNSGEWEWSGSRRNTRV